MKRQCSPFIKYKLVCLLACLNFLVPCADAAEEEPPNCETLAFFYNLWEESAFGKAPNRIERAAWIIQENGTSQFQRWPQSGERNKELWKGPIPENVIAQVHTHPANRDPRPSNNDAAFARKVNVPVYTITGSGIWRVTPEGKIAKLMAAEWHRVCDSENRNSKR